VDRSAEVRNGAAVVAALDGELVVKYLRLVGERMFLVPGNPDKGL
jgi:DNA polymerase V